MQNGWVPAAAALVVMLVTGSAYQMQWLGSDKIWWRRLAFKGFTTLVAAALALWGAGRSGLEAHYWLAAGLAICAVADMALEVRFKLGMLLFALGHLCYIRAFLLEGGLSAQSLYVFAALAVVSIWMGFRLRKRLSQPPAAVVAYMLVIGFMFALALMQPPLLAVGALCFVASDALIFYRLGFEAGRWNDLFCILLYWLGQYLIALSTIFK